jgi:hypothetical protein
LIEASHGIHFAAFDRASINQQAGFEIDCLLASPRRSGTIAAGGFKSPHIVSTFFSRFVHVGSKEERKPLKRGGMVLVEGTSLK